MTRLGIRVDDRALRRKLGRLPTGLERNLRAAFGVMAAEHVSAMQARMRRGGGARNVGFSRVVKSRTGHLFRSFTSEIRASEGNVGGLRMRIFSAGVSYANIQEFGGVVTPRPPRRFLTIPMPANLTAAGMPRLISAAGVRGDPTHATFVLKTRDGRLFIAGRTGERKKITLLWRLVPRVTLAGGLGWFDTWRGAATRRTELLREAARGALAARGDA